MDGNILCLTVHVGMHTFIAPILAEDEPRSQANHISGSSVCIANKHGSRRAVKNGKGLVSFITRMMSGGHRGWGSTVNTGRVELSGASGVCGALKHG